jgi:hypothetical protein
MSGDGRFEVAFTLERADASFSAAMAARADTRERLREERAVFPRSNKWLRGVQPCLSAVPLPYLEF